MGKKPKLLTWRFQQAVGKYITPYLARISTLTKVLLGSSSLSIVFFKIYITRFFSLIKVSVKCSAVHLVD